jgi:hypothetical protein
MTAYNQNFPWLSHSGGYNFFESKMLGHNKVNWIKSKKTGLYEIFLNDGRTLNVFICECYSFGIAEYYESIENLGPLDAIIINSNWCGYSIEVKLHCQNINVGVFNIGGFMAAINKLRFWDYFSEVDKGYV